MFSPPTLTSRGLARAELLIPPVLLLQEEQRMMFSTPSAPERLQELRGTTSSTPASSSKRPVLRMGESMTFKDQKPGKTTVTTGSWVAT